MRYLRSNIILILVMLVVFGCQTKGDVLPTKTLSPEDILLKKLNDPTFEELNALECPGKDLGFRVPGETIAYNEIYKKDLQNIGVRVRWNCEKKFYEIVSDGQSSLPICGCQANETNVPGTTFSRKDIALINLNDWYPDELDVFECRVDHPDTIPTDKTTAHVEEFKQRLQDIVGVQARWDCKKQLYEIVPDGESSSPICGCQPPETPLSTAAPSP